MRGAENAGGHAANPVCLATRTKPVCTRALAGDIAENPTERAKAAPAGLERDVGDGEIGIAQQRRGLLDAPRQQIAMRRHAEGLFERSREMRRGNTADTSQPLHWPVFVWPRIHHVLCAQQPTQDTRILASNIGAHATPGSSTETI